MSAGPVQVLVLGLDEPTFDGVVLAELARLGDAGVVRLVDLLLVRRAADGTLETVDVEGQGELATALLDGAGPASPDGSVGSDGSDQGAGDTWSLDDAVPAGGLALVALIEHLWAGPLAARLQSAGATLLEESWLSPADRALLASLESRHPA